MLTSKVMSVMPLSPSRLLGLLMLRLRGVAPGPAAFASPGNAGSRIKDRSEARTNQRRFMATSTLPACATHDVTRRMRAAPTLRRVVTKVTWRIGLGLVPSYRPRGDRYQSFAGVGRLVVGEVRVARLA